MSVLIPQVITEAPETRARFVIDRLKSINKTASELIYENGLLLREYKSGAYFKLEGYKTFDEAINMMQQKGELDYSSRNARNFIAIVDMFDTLAISPADASNIGVSKLREIATLEETEQRKLLAEAPEMSVADVQKAAKRIRDKAAGRDVDPLDPLTIYVSETQKQLVYDCVSLARKVYGINDEVPVADVLEAILADWHSGINPEEHGFS
jgi:hypothetical protein